MKKTFRYLFAAVLALCLMQISAFAAAPLQVQLDGKPVEFTDAEPRVVNERIFLPFRAVFEAMGAEVGYSGNTVSAERDGKVITMTIGSTEAIVTENGVKTTLTMDVAPFVDPAINRTYVPVRFAAQALGANVGWDQSKQTAVIVDVERQIDKVMAGKSFTYLEKLVEYEKRYDEGIWGSEIAMKGAISLDTAALNPSAPMEFTIPIEISAIGTTKDNSKTSVEETLKIDLSSVNNLIVAMLADENTTAEEIEQVRAVVKGLADQGVSASARGDLETGKFYVSIDLSALGELSDEMELFNKNTWFALDLKALAEQSGGDYADLLASVNVNRDLDFKDLLVELAAAYDVNDAETGYIGFCAFIEEFADLLCDSSFTRSGNVCTREFSVEEDGIVLRLVLSMTIRNDAVTAYSVEVELNGGDEASGKIAMTVKIAIDEQDRVSGKMTMDVFDVFDEVKADFDISGKYEKGGAAPAVTPPEGAVVIDLMELFSGLGGLE